MKIGRNVQGVGTTLYAAYYKTDSLLVQTDICYADVFLCSSWGRKCCLLDSILFVKYDFTVRVHIYGLWELQISS